MKHKLSNAVFLALEIISGDVCIDCDNDIDVNILNSTSWRRHILIGP